MDKALVTRAVLVDGLRILGVETGDCLLVHVSLSALGFVPGAERTVVESLVEAVGSSGTVMMPTYSGELSDPAEWKHPPVPKDWIAPINQSTPPYNAMLTPTRKMGTVPEYFRNYPGVIRSAHPQSSFAALGAKAHQLVSHHPLDMRFGPTSPLGSLVREQGKSLLLGAPLNTNSLLYLTLYGEDKRTLQKSAPVSTEEGTVWATYTDIEISNAWFADFSHHAIEQRAARRGRIGDAQCYLFFAAPTLNAAKEWRASGGGEL